MAGDPLSVAVTTVVNGDAAAASKPTVPEITPVAASMDNPLGKPVAEKVKEFAGRSASVTVIGSATTSASADD
jgi:hypothetical protein